MFPDLYPQKFREAAFWPIWACLPQPKNPKVAVSSGAERLNDATATQNLGLGLVGKKSESWRVNVDSSYNDRRRAKTAASPLGHFVL
jgi:hypothetical protein